ncbi:site-specific DNA-methyltransferase [Globicatella sp. PHS-GS-PNBC-21-1553]|uniref:site-specific DNA-methyltransferase n=1 Tax=Globicatella sp. PHS-GS-PNBC-21-1553 TaxID=2885764 RepID=UPI00298F0653|nr:site-specific DNA-methyltransferase [Globicatella sp. PHS-GS-PNBC-21-1553]WPC09092.1 site-specific DNA-methyltransferase [Globicatella sp. PHS-GS-PNBC-21-1553]
MSNKLELTWYGKDKEIKVEPRVLIEDKEKSNIKNDPNTENMLIHGDNLLALKALESKYSGQVKCIYIDPPYNTGSAFEHYDDNLEHSTWLSLMKPRIEILRNLLDDEYGSLWISIDDDEGHYLKTLCDEIFGRNNFVNTCIWQKKHTRSNDAKWFSDNHDFILVYAKNKEVWKPNLLPRSEESKKGYTNPDNDPRGVWASGPCHVKTPNEKDIYPIITPSGRKVMPPAGTSWRFSKDKMDSLIKDNRIWFGENGDNVPRYKRFLTDVQQGFVPLTLWFRDEVGDNQEAKKEVKQIDPISVFGTPKPERLIERVLTLATNEGDLVLDSFLGSGTTAAVAHKMNRKYIGIEMGNHAYTHCKVRLDKVISGEDNGGISVSKDYYDLKEDDLKDLDFDIEDVKTFNKILNKIGKETDLIPKDVLKELKKKTRTQKIKSELKWQGGGAYRFYELAESLINKDSFGEYVINKEYNPDMLAAAVALHEGFEYKPDDEYFWKQARANEKSYLFVTTRHLNESYIESIRTSMEDDEYLIVACKSFDSELEGNYANITIKKIPQMLLSKCEFGRDNYNLNIISPPSYDQFLEDEEEDDE